MSALSGAQHLASSGRTSFAVDKALPRDAYRVLGYRQCGERAVRVDILERLADLIRPALAWRESSPGEKPAGAFDGRSFVVTQAMTSLTGSAGEDFASILRALGYRMEKRAPLPPKPVAATEPVVVAEAAPVEGAEAVADAAAPTEATADAPVEAVAEAPARPLMRPWPSRSPAIPRHRPPCCPRSRSRRRRPKSLRWKPHRSSKPPQSLRRWKHRSRKRRSRKRQVADSTDAAPAR